MHWVWVSERTADDEAMIYGPLNFSSVEDIKVDTGFTVSARGPLTDIIRGEHSQGEMPDNVLLRGNGGLLFSPRLRQVLEKISLDNIQYFPVTVQNPVDGTQISDYQVANIIGRLACLDRDESVLVTDPDNDNIIEFIEKLAIDEDKLSGFDLVRMHEESEIIVASDRVKDACEQAGITGVRFYKPAEHEH